MPWRKPKQGSTGRGKQETAALNVPARLGSSTPTAGNKATRDRRPPDTQPQVSPRIANDKATRNAVPRSCVRAPGPAAALPARSAPESRRPCASVQHSVKRQATNPRIRSGKVQKLESTRFERCVAVRHRGHPANHHQNAKVPANTHASSATMKSDQSRANEDEAMQPTFVSCSSRDARLRSAPSRSFAPAHGCTTHAASGI
jgi:hypothetical protein